MATKAISISNKGYYSIPVIIVLWLIYYLFISLPSFNEENIFFNSSNISGRIGKVKEHGRGRWHFELYGSDAMFYYNSVRFYQLNGIRGEDDIFQIGDSINKQSYSDTVIVVRNGKTTVYIFNKY